MTHNKNVANIIALGMLLALPGAVSAKWWPNLTAHKHTDKEKKVIKEFRLEDGPLRALLDRTFAKTKDPARAFEKAGFTLIEKGERSVVAMHQDHPGYIFKASKRAKESRKYKGSNASHIERLACLKRVNACLERHQAELVDNNLYIIVPQKWIYTIPKTKFVVVITQELDLADELTSKSALQNLSKSQLKAIRDFVTKVKGWNPNSKSLKIADDASSSIAVVSTKKHSKLRLQLNGKKVKKEKK